MNNKFSKLNSKNLISPKIYYLVGSLRDGCLTTQNTIKIKQKNREWLEGTVLPVFTEVFGRKFKNNIYYQNDRYPVWYIAFKDKEIWNILNEYLSKQPKTYKEKKFYIMAFWDTDGGCPKNPSKDKKLYIKFTQKDKQSLIELKEMLETFHVKSGSIRVSENTDTGIIWRFSINSRESMKQFCEEIGSLHPEKKLRLEKIKFLLTR